MKNQIPQRSIFAYYVFSVLTLGIYTLVFWHKLSKQVNVLCEGDGKKTMKYFPAWIISIFTLGIFGLVWKYKLAERLKDNAERYSGAVVVVASTVGLVTIVGPAIARGLLIRNFNAIAGAYNEYNGLVDPDADKLVDIFGDTEVEL